MEHSFDRERRASSVAAFAIMDESATSETVAVGGIATWRINRAELADLMVEDAMKARRGEIPVPRMVVSSNGLVIAAFHRDPAFRSLIEQADIVDADGMPLVLASRLLCKHPLRERVATTDFIHDASAIAAKKGVRFYFLGAKPGVADTAAARLKEMYPGLEIAGVRHGYYAQEEEADICREILESSADILWLGLGSPRQEAFAVANRERLAGLAWVRTCGGMFDHCAGSVPRAPMWMQNTGLEWLHRAIREPFRLGGRYLATNPSALYHLLTKTHD